MQNAISWFEIAVADRDRAKNFYEAIFNFKMQALDINETLKMAIFPVEPNAVGGALVQNSSFYKPSENGSLVYLNANSGMDEILKRILANKGNVIISKRLISPDRGYMALFIDSEGNRIALHSST